MGDAFHNGRSIKDASPYSPNRQSRARQLTPLQLAREHGLVDCWIGETATRGRPVRRVDRARLRLVPDG